MRINAERGVHKYGIILRGLICEWHLTEAFAFRTTNERVMIFHSALASSALRSREEARAAMAMAAAVTLLWPLRRRRRWALNARVSGEGGRTVTGGTMLRRKQDKLRCYMYVPPRAARSNHHSHQQLNEYFPPLFPLRHSGYDLDDVLSEAGMASKRKISTSTRVKVSYASLRAFAATKN